jgi:arabinose-5-phosphate isomerase
MTALPLTDDHARAPALGGRAEVERVLRMEANAILALAESLDDSIDQAVEVLVNIAGRVVVTGMGKSGHVARKIAATLASTGSPALFVHPAEASHGDLGMIAANDAVLALSNSGDTPELADIVAYTRRFRIPLVAISGRARSTLGEQADVVLQLPRTPEACPMNLAPTSSTTMMLALGDALALALLQRRGFSPSDFQALHPGGQLGKRLLRVSDIMHGQEQLPLIGPQASMQEAILEMTAKKHGVVGIVDPGGRLVGIITDGDLRRHMGGDLLQLTAGDVMTAQPKTIRPQALAAEALGFMNASKITSLFVVVEDRPIGFLNMHDCLRAGVR